MRILPRTILATAVAFGMAAAPAAAQLQSGLVNVNVSDISVELEDVIADNNLNVQVPVAAVVQVPIGIAANVCNISAAVLARQAAGAAPCEATNETATRNEIAAVARALQRQQR
jgi:hypothetical protein